MTDKNLETRIKKLEEHYRDLKDITKESNESIEDLYDSINNLKTPIASMKNGKYLNVNHPDSSKHPDRLDYSDESDESDESDCGYSGYSGYSDSASSSSIKTQANKSSKIDKETLDINKLIKKFHLAVDTEIYEQAKFFLKYLESVSVQSCQNENLNAHILLEHFINLDKTRRLDIIEKMKQHESASVSINIHNQPKLIIILESSMSIYHQKMAINKLHMLDNMDKQDPEYWKLSQWLDNLLAIPFNKYRTPAILNTTDNIIANQNALVKNPQSVPEIFAHARKILDSVIYGQTRTKEHMLAIIARMISNPTTHGTVFAVEGVAGCGKTTLIKTGLAQIMGLPFEFISLGGANEVAYLAGQNYTYIGSIPGKIIQGLKQAKCMNPIFYFDELDKVSATERGQEIINLLIHITDPGQNGHFQDLYMDGIPVDLSRAIFVFSFNDRHRVSPILLDRMEVIKFHTYTPTDKQVIIERHLIPQVMETYFGAAASRIKCIMKGKSQIMDRLVFNTRSADGIVKKKKLDSTSGIRTIIRRLDKAIARVNLRIQEKGCNIGKIKKIILTARLFRKNWNF
jgi:ATP-dependent Lon protease